MGMMERKSPSPRRRNRQLRHDQTPHSAKAPPTHKRTPRPGPDDRRRAGKRRKANPSNFGSRSHPRRGLAHAFTPHTKRVPCPSRVLCERAGLLADIAASDHRIHAKLLTTTRCPARFPIWNRVLGQPAFHLDRSRSTAIIYTRIGYL